MEFGSGIDPSSPLNKHMTAEAEEETRAYYDKMYQTMSEDFRVQSGLDWLSSRVEGTSVYSQQTANGCLFNKGDIGNSDLAELFKHAAEVRADALRQEDSDDKKPPLPYEPLENGPILMMTRPCLIILL